LVEGFVGVLLGLHVVDFAREREQKRTAGYAVR
jgi:hypothetical protein